MSAAERQALRECIAAGIAAKDGRGTRHAIRRAANTIAPPLAGADSRMAWQCAEAAARIGQHLRRVITAAGWKP